MPLDTKNIYRFFQLSIILKGLDAVIEIFGGLLALFIPPYLITNTLTALMRKELIEDPHDFIATHAMSLAKQYSVSNETFAALYLLSHGIVKIILVINLLENKSWAYPASLSIFGVFAAYQAYLFVFTHSLFMGALTVFDLMVIWFIWQEFKSVRKQTL